LKYLQQYRIPFSGLKNDHHVFNFSVDKRFFDHYEYSIVKNGDLHVEVSLDKQETLMIAHFSIKGNILLACDLCLNEYPREISVQERLIIKFQGDDTIQDDTEEILVLSKNDYEINLAPLIYEYINLAVPFHSRCDRPGEHPFCDVATLSKLRDLEDKASTAEEQDPRWDILKKIKNN